MRTSQFLSLAVILRFGAVVSFLACQARGIPHKSSVVDGQSLGSPDVPRTSVHHSTLTLDGTINERPKIDLTIQKRRVPIRQSGSKPATAPDRTHTVRLFKVEATYTDTEWKCIAFMFRKIAELFAVMFVGMELEPQHNIHVRLGALTLNLYAITEALTQSVVLAVSNKLLQMALRGFPPLGLGEVVVGAGVRVLFAAGIRLQGLNDMYEFGEDIGIVGLIENYIG